MMERLHGREGFVMLAVGSSRSEPRQQDEAEEEDSRGPFRSRCRCDDVDLTEARSSGKEEKYRRLVLLRSEAFVALVLRRGQWQVTAK